LCVIIDTNLASTIFANSPHPDFLPVLEWLENRGGCLVVGGQLAAELDRLETARRYVLALLRAGKARKIPDEDVELHEREIEETGLCRSNDLHVLGLACASGARTLCTQDRELQRDFRNPRIVSNPRGSIYLRPAHARLLRHGSACGELSRKR
jgi:PIN domain